eukprot:TRINITY_DN30237_c0_g2_i1.p1 TRINITY_DN30237_c0_g2~~TRINITY_DN30237_c0_g2_i1.p1  ORF type:complete len:246 (+),score=52.05 TRINITY_DN30237_c0_g2_i1:71-808(+)
MDPESGTPLPLSTGEANRGESVVKKVIQAVVQRLQAILGALKPADRNVGVENRFYFDKEAGVWKLQNETEQDRADAEALRFHTSRGLSTAAAPPTTACDPTRRGEFAAPPPPPPTGGPVTRSLHGASGGISSSMSAALSHPVYAPQGMGAAAAPPPAVAPPPAFAPPPAAAALSAGPPQASQPPSAPPGTAVRTSPFGGGPTPLANPFGQPAAAKAAGAPTPLASPFAALPAQQGPFAAVPPASA